jgi:hypothetical protein
MSMRWIDGEGMTTQNIEIETDVVDTTDCPKCGSVAGEGCGFWNRAMNVTWVRPHSVRVELYLQSNPSMTQY